MSNELKTNKIGYPSIDKPWLSYFSNDAIASEIPQYTAYEYLWENSKEHLDDIALCYFDRKITFQYMFDQIQLTANGFSAIGIKEGDVVALCAVTTPETIYTFYALNYIGAVANIIDPRTNYERIKQYITTSMTKCIVVIDKCVPIANKLQLDGFEGKIITFSPADSLPAIKKMVYNMKNKLGKSYDSNSMISWNDFFEDGE